MDKNLMNDMMFSDKNLAKILLINDDPDNLHAIQETLSPHSYDLEYARDGDIALELTQKQDYDLVLLDFKIPGSNGSELCKSIRSNKNFLDTPILFLSEDTDKGSILEGFNAGAQDFISMPFEPGELLARVNTHLEIKFGREQLKKTNRLLEEEVREKKNELEKAMMELDDLDSKKMDFLHIISHEIRTPLNTILGPISLMKNSMKDRRYRGLIDMLDSSASRLEKFTLTALAITELRTSQQRIAMEKISLDRLIRELIAVNELIKLKNLCVEFTPGPKENFIAGNEAMVSRCLRGIIENAMIFSPIGGKIKIGISKSRDSIICEISDEGPGFSDAALRYLFRLFMPGEPHVDQNLGLDLTLARLIMDAHSGSIQAGNLPGRGAVVKLIFPGNEDKAY